MVLVLHSLRGTRVMLAARCVLLVPFILVALSTLGARRAMEWSLPLSSSSRRVGLSTTETTST